MGDEVSCCADRDQLLVFARHWLYERRLLIVHGRAIRTLIAAALVDLETQTAAQIRVDVRPVFSSGGARPSLNRTLQARRVRVGCGRRMASRHVTGEASRSAPTRDGSTPSATL